MSEDDWAKLDAVFDVGARAEAATDDLTAASSHGAAVGGDDRGGIRLAQGCRRRSGNL